MEGLTEDLSSQVAAFVEQWQLKEDAQQVLQGLEPKTLSRVLADFHPRDATRDANAIFHRFTQGVLRNEQAKQGGGEDPGGFVARWNLSEEAQNMLFGFDPQLQAKVMFEFAPRDAERDVSNIFMKFAMGVAKGSGKGFKAGGGKGGYAPRPSSPWHFQSPAASWPSPSNSHIANYAIPSFVDQWNLEYAAQQLLESLPEATAMQIMREFRPRDTSRAVDGLFMKFAQSVASSAGVAVTGAWQAPPGQQHLAWAPPNGGHDVMNFCRTWGLSQEAHQLLESLPPETRRRVMAEFAPRDATSDVNNIFFKFAQGVSAGKGFKGKGKMANGYYHGSTPY